MVCSINGCQCFSRYERNLVKSIRIRISFPNWLKIIDIFLLFYYFQGKFSHGNGRIINGNDSDVLPYQVRLLGGCGGSIIDLKWILTAKHCVINRYTGQLVSDTVKAGIANLKDDSKKMQLREIPINAIILHHSAG